MCEFMACNLYLDRTDKKWLKFGLSHLKCLEAYDNVSGGGRVRRELEEVGIS